MSGFSAIVRDESDMSTKNQMLDYLCELMDDAQDFGWSAAKGVHAVLLCRMEEYKVAWHQTEAVRQSKRSESGVGKSNQSVSPHSSLCSDKKYFRTRIVTSSRVLYGESKNWVQDFNRGSSVSYAQTSGTKNSASIAVKVLKVSPRRKHVNQVNKPQVAHQESATKTFSNVQNLAKNKNYNKSQAQAVETQVSNQLTKVMC